MKILLTGDRGFIGTNLKNKLKELGHEVCGMDIAGDASLDDISKEHNVECELKNTKPDVIIHLAALAGVRKSLKIPDEYYKVNITGTHWLLKWAIRTGVKKFLFASSSSVYGDGESPLKEKMECNSQLSPYAVSKKAAEMVCKMFSRKIPVIVFRPFTVYGPKGRPDMVIGEILRAGRENTEFVKYGDGKSSRGYTHVDDLTDGIIKLLDYQPKDNYEVFNLGGSEVIFLNELIKIVKSKFPFLKIREIPMPEVDVLHSNADIKKARKKVGWEPKRKFKEELLKLC